MATDKHSSVPEGFKEIPGYGGRYFINQNGDVWSVARRRLMSPQFSSKSGYPFVLLQTPGKGARTASLHYLMRLTWMPPAPGAVGIRKGEWCVNHKDGDKLNNCLSNLEWVTVEQNTSHAWHSGLHLNMIGENARHSIFTSDQARQIRLRLLLGEKVKDLAAEYNCSLSGIKNLKKYHAWKHQDWDLIEPMMEICDSQCLPAMLECIKENRFYDFSHAKPNWRYEIKSATD